MTEYFNQPEGLSGEPSSDKSRKPAILALNGRRWLLGMTWQTYEAQLDRQELLEEAASLQADWVAQRSGDEVVQTGYCEAVTQGWPKKLYSLSALLADSYKVPWAGAFDLGDGSWWYIAVRDNYTIMPDGDVVGSREDIFRARQEHASIEDFNHVDGTRADLEKLIRNSQGRRTPIESVTSSRFHAKQILAAIIALLVVVAGIGGYFYWQHQETARQNAERIAQQRAALQRAHLAQQPQSPDLATLLRTRPDPSVWLAACQRAIYGVPPWEKGWQLAGQQCTAEGQVKITWRRRLSATIAYRPSGALDPDGNGVKGSFPLVFDREEGTVMALPIEDARERLILWGQLHDIVINIHGDPNAQAKVQQNALSKLPGQKPPPIIKQYSIDFVAPVAPFDLDFTGLTGFRLTELKHIPANPDPDAKQVMDAAWQFTGVLYGR
ncbi:MAG: type 4b pilus protein PilO2 [Rhodanobacter sp.]